MKTRPQPRPVRFLDGGGSPRAEELTRALPSAEPPPGARARVWKRLTVPPARARRVRWILVPAAAAASLIVALVTVVRGPVPPAAPLATVTLVRGEVVVAGSSAVAAVAPGQKIASGAIVRTGPDGRAHLRFADAGLLLERGTEVLLRGDRRSRIEVALARGTITVAVRPRSPGRALVVRAGRHVIRVVGTAFEVHRGPARHLRVRVFSGVVEVTGPRVSRRLRRGEVWTAGPGAGPPSSLPADPPGAALARALLTKPAAEALLRIEGPGDLEVELDGMHVGRPPLLLLVPVGRRELETRRAGRGSVRIVDVRAGKENRVVLAPSPASLETTPVREAPGEHRPGQREPEPAEGGAPRPSAAREPAPTRRAAQAAARRKPARAPTRARRSSVAARAATPARPEAPPRPLPPSPPPIRAGAVRQPAAPAPARASPPTGALATAPGRRDGDPASKAFARAGELARAGRYREAARLFEDLARSSGTHAELALYEIARLKQHHLGDPKGAAEGFRAYLRRYPRGSLRREAGVSLIECLLSAGDLGAASSAADRFLAAHPRSERRSEVRLLRAHLRRERGDCRTALPEYEALAEVRERTGDDASFFAAFCEKALGRLQAARRRLIQYLKRFPQGRHRAEARRALRGGERQR